MAIVAVVLFALLLLAVPIGIELWLNYARFGNPFDTGYGKAAEIYMSGKKYGWYDWHYIPQHVHMHVIEPGRCTYFIDEIHFLDDPRLSELERKQAGTGRGGPGLVMPRRDPGGTWVVVRDIILGEKIPGYPATVNRTP